MADTRKTIDWEKGEKLYRLGQLSSAEIGKQIGCSTSTVIRHMEKLGIARDMAAEVLRRTQEAIATQRNAQCNVAQVTEEDIQGAVSTNIALVMSHRADLRRIAEIESKLIDELDNDPTKLYVAQYQGGVVEKEMALTVTEKSTTLANLMSVRSKRIEKQRQAFGIKDETEGDKAGLTVTISEADLRI